MKRQVRWLVLAAICGGAALSIRLTNGDGCVFGYGWVFGDGWVLAIELFLLAAALGFQATEPA